MNQDQIITLIISELNKDSRLRQVVQQIAVKASGGIVKQEPPWPGNRPENFGISPNGYEVKNLGMIFDWSTREWISNPYSTQALPDKITVKDSQGNEINMSTIRYPNGAMEFTDSNGNVLMSSGDVEAGKNWPTYTEMVADLFKPMPTKIAMVIHAAIGLAGESGELREAVDHKEAREEAGDLTFYLEALRQQLPPNNGNVELLTEVTSSPYYRPSHATVVDNIHIISSQILDVAKKAWAYEKELDTFSLSWLVELFQIQLNYCCSEFLGVPVEQIKYANQAKLMKRYKGGKYSNAAAIAREDKQ